MIFLKIQYACEADTTTGGGCTWCKSGTTPSACYTIEDAHKFPSSVFACDFPSEEVKEVNGIDACNTKYGAGDSAAFIKTCEADKTTGGGCTWCKSGTTPSACYTIEDAHKFPSSVFACDFPSFL